MAGSVNKVILIGNLGADPEIRTMQNGGKVANLSLATTETWKDRNSGERREKTEWHRVVVFNPGLVTICENYLRKGAKVYLEGALETRSWEQDGQKKYTTEVVLKNFNGQLTMLDGRSGGSSDAGGGYSQNNQGGYGGGQNYGGGQQSQPAPQIDEMEDEIPF